MDSTRNDRKARIQQKAEHLKKNPRPVPPKEPTLAEELTPTLNKLVAILDNQNELLNELTDKGPAEVNLDVNVPDQKQVKSWDFTIHRHNNGLISSITAIADRGEEDE